MYGLTKLSLRIKEKSLVGTNGKKYSGGGGDEGLERTGVDTNVRIYSGGGGDEGLRRRGVGTNGRIRLTIIYDGVKSELKLFVHEAAGLPG